MPLKGLQLQRHALRVIKFKKLLIFFACLCSMGSSPTHAKDDHGVPVTLQLRWMPQFQFAGYYMADAKGFYEDEGIDIRIIPGNGNRTQMMEEVLSGRADFGIGNSGLALASMQNKPITVVANIFQRSAAVMVTKPGFEKSIKELSKKNLSLRTLQDNPEIYAVFNSVGVIPADLPIMAKSPNALDEFISGRADAINAYLSNEPFTLKQKGISFTLIDPTKYGIDFYGDALFTRTAFIKNNQDIVNRFVRASIKGWIYAIDHTDETIEYLHNNVATDKSLEHLRYEAKVVKDLILPDYVPIGQISLVRWEKIGETYKSLGLAPKDSEISPEFYASYWQIRSEEQAFWTYSIGALLLVSIIGAIGIWYASLNRRLNKLLVEKNSLLNSVEELANYDFLTKLPSRRLIYDRIQRSIKLAFRNKTKVAICLIDLNGFKKINDEFGHLVGDQVLIEAGKRMERWVRASDSVGRMGGDEFLVCMENIHNESEINAPIERLRKEFEPPFLIGQQQFKLSFSIGWALYPDDGEQPDELINLADKAMYRNKSRVQHSSQEATSQT